MKSMMKFIAVAAIAVVAVASFAQGGGGGQGRGGGGFGQGRGFGGMQDASGVFLLRRDDVAGELKLTSDQKSKLQAIQEAQMEKMRDAFQNGGGGDREAMMAQAQKMMAENQKEVYAVLDDTQKKRLKELAIQRMGNSAITNADIQKELGITDDQKTKIKDLQTKQQEANAALRQRDDMDRQARQEAQQKNNEILNAELGKVLTEAQKTKLKDMGGKPFKFVEQNRGGGN